MVRNARLDQALRFVYTPKGMTIKELRERLWWWRRRNPDWAFNPKTSTRRLKPSSQNHHWLETEEVVAWRYELARRVHRSSDLPPYPEAKGVKDHMMAALEEYSQKKRRLQVVRFDDVPVSNDLTILNRQNWTDVHTIQCDLEATDHQLSEGFLSFLRAERAIRGITPRRGPRGKRHRQVSWLWPELLDIDHFKIRALNASERSQLSRARKLSQSLHEYLVDYFTPVPESDEPLSEDSLRKLPKLLMRRAAAKKQ